MGRALYFARQGHTQKLSEGKITNVCHKIVRIFQESEAINTKQHNRPEEGQAHRTPLRTRRMLVMSLIFSVLLKRCK